MNSVKKSIRLTFKKCFICDYSSYLTAPLCCNSKYSICQPCLDCWLTYNIMCPVCRHNPIMLADSEAKEQTVK
jgi:hypothetical protein